MMKSKEMAEPESSFLDEGEDPKVIGDRIGSLRRPGESVREFAQRIGVSASGLKKWLRGVSKPNLQNLRRIAIATGKPLSWIATGGPASQAKSLYGSFSVGPSEISGTVKVPIYDARASAGPGAFVDQDLVTGHMHLDSAWIREVVGASTARLVMTQAIGNSMEPTIFSGDRLLVETTEGARFDSGIYVVVMGSDVMVKRYSRGSGGSLVLKSDNPAYADIEVSAEEQRDDCRLVGRVRLILRVP